jgi:hypothetical protein
VQNLQENDFSVHLPSVSHSFSSWVLDAMTNNDQICPTTSFLY